MHRSTVRENVLYELLLEERKYLNNIMAGYEEIDQEELNAIHEDIDNKVENYFCKDKSIVIIMKYGDAPDIGTIDLYEITEIDKPITFITSYTIEKDIAEIAAEYRMKHIACNVFCSYPDDLDEKQNVVHGFNNDDEVITIRNNILVSME